MRIVGDSKRLHVDSLDEWEYLKARHIKNSYLYRLDVFLTEYKKSLHPGIRSDVKSKDILSQKKKIIRIDKKLLELQFYVPFIHLNIDSKTLVSNNEFKLTKNVNIMILEEDIKKADVNIIELAHDKLTSYQKLLMSDKRRVNIKKNLILSNLNKLTVKDYLAYSYIYRLKDMLYVKNTDKTTNFDFSSIPSIPGLIFKSTVNRKVHKKKGNKVENIEIIIDVNDIMKASEDELKHAHKILSEYLRVSDQNSK